MFQKLQALEERYEELSQMLGDADLIAIPEKYRKAAQAHAGLQEIIDKFREYKSISQEIAGTKSLLEEERDEELLEMARQEFQKLEEQKASCEEALKVLLLPKDPNEAKNIILEIRAGTGGMKRLFLLKESSGCIRDTPSATIGS